MKFSFLPLLCLFAAGTLQARVFETYDQCVTRYGKPLTTTKTDIGSTVSFVKNNVSITVEFRKDTAVGVTYFKLSDKEKPAENRAFSKEEITTLLESNGSEHKWGAERKDMNAQPYWVTTDSALNARLTAERTILNVQDGAEFARKAKDTPPATKPAKRDLEGF